MDDIEFDKAMITAGFEQAALTGWRGLSIVEAARGAGLPLDRARARFPGPAALLLRFGLMADQAALAEPSLEATVRERLFDLLMRRFDVFQQHREGVLAVLRALPTDPVMALGLGAATLRSMAWMLEAAGVPAAGIGGQLRAQGLVGVWLYVLRAWTTDDSADLAGTMAALDKALDQAARYSNTLADPFSRGKASAMNDDPLEGVIDLPDDAPMPDLTDMNPPPPPPPEPPPPPMPPS